MTNVLSRCRNVLYSVTVVILNICYHQHYLCSKSLDFFRPWTTNCTYCAQSRVMLNCLELIVLCQQLIGNNFINMVCNIYAQRFSQMEKMDSLNGKLWKWRIALHSVFSGTCWYFTFSVLVFFKSCGLLQLSVHWQIRPVFAPPADRKWD